MLWNKENVALKVASGWQFIGFHSGDYDGLGYYATWTGKWLPTFRRIGLTSSGFFDLLTIPELPDHLDEGTILLRNVDTNLPVVTA